MVKHLRLRNTSIVEKIMYRTLPYINPHLGGRKILKTSASYLEQGRKKSLVLVCLIKVCLSLEAQDKGKRSNPGLL